MTQHRSSHGAWEGDEVEPIVRAFAANTSQYGVVLLNAGGKISGWSEGSFCITGFSADEVLGQDFAMLFTREDAAAGMHLHELNAAHTLGNAEDERWHNRKDGSTFWASGMTFARWDGESHIGYAKLFRDATHLQLRMSWLENEVQRLTRERQSHDRFIVTLAHELRNPLQPIALAMRLLSRAHDEATRMKALDIIRRQLGFAERLIEDLVDMTRIGEGKLRLDYEHLALQPLLEEALTSCQEYAGAVGLRPIAVMPPTPVWVDVDPARLQQVVVNLLNNAVKFTPAGGRVSLLLNMDQTHFLIKVQDSGVGIGPDIQPRIFDMFTQADGANTARGQGLGIGLALVKEIVSLHRGTVEVKSEGPDKGSEFTVRIPLARPAGVADQ